MSDDRALREELETLQHQAKVLRAEQELSHAAGFDEARFGWTRQLAVETPAMEKAQKLAAQAAAKDAALSVELDAQQRALSVAEQRRLSPVLALVMLLFAVALLFQSGPSLSLDLVSGRSVISRIMAIGSSALLGLLLGSRLRLRAGHGWGGVPPQSSWLARLRTHLFLNPAVWGALALGLSWVVLFPRFEDMPSELSRFMDRSWGELAAVLSVAFCIRGLSSEVTGHHASSRIVFGLAAATFLFTGFAVFGSLWMEPFSEVNVAALVVALAAPFVAAVLWFVLDRLKRRPPALWVVPAVVSVVASLTLLMSPATAAASPANDPEWFAWASRHAPHMPRMLVRDDLNWVEAEKRVKEAAWYGSQEQLDLQASAASRVVSGLSAFLLAAAGALLGMIGAWLFGAGRRSLRALAVVPAVVLLAVVLLRSAG